MGYRLPLIAMSVQEVDVAQIRMVVGAMDEARIREAADPANLSADAGRA